MTREQLLARISIDPKVCFGKPCIRGHRVWVSLILYLLAGGTTLPQILQEYPQLTEADVLACIAYGAEMARERYIDLEFASFVFAKKAKLRSRGSLTTQPSAASCARQVSPSFLEASFPLGAPAQGPARRSAAAAEPPRQGAVPHPPMPGSSFSPL